MIARLILITLCAALGFADMASAQTRGQNRNLLGSFRDWDALTTKEADGSKTCYMISTPKDSTASRKGARRGDIYVTVTHRPKFGVTGEVSTVMGYPLKVGSDVRVEVDGKSRFNLFTEGTAAWAYDARDDGRITTAMKRGNRLVIRGTSTRGTNTTDTYSLSGFTAAYNAITKACR